jgi:hypothetical protein
MNPYAIKRFLVTIFVTVLANFAVAGPGVSGGGDAVNIGNKYYLLDLVEAGVERNPYIDRNIEVNPKHLARLKVALNDQFPHLLIAKKLAEVYKVNRFLALAILKTIEAYQWRVVNKSLIDIIDENTDLKVPRQDLYQLAARKNVSILIDRLLWDQIGEVHKTALVFHEALYALNEPQNTGKDFVRGYPIQTQSSAKSREINGFLFSDLPRQGRSGLDRLERNLPLALWRSSSTDDTVFEDGIRISADPFIQFVIEGSKIWENSREAKAGVSLYRQGPVSVETQVATNCAISLQTGLMIDIVARAGGLSQIRARAIINGPFSLGLLWQLFVGCPCVCAAGKHFVRPSRSATKSTAR